VSDPTHIAGIVIIVLWGLAFILLGQSLFIFMCISLAFGTYIEVRTSFFGKEKWKVDAPWWIYIVVMGIMFSAYMMIRAVKEEREIDQAFIEKEGEVYMERIREERARRQKEKALP